MTWQAANSPKDLSSHFPFGENWADYERKIDDSRIAEADAGLKKLLGEGGPSRKTFLDVGCGSGLYSLVALRLGCDRVLALDIDDWLGGWTTPADVDARLTALGSQLKWTFMNLPGVGFWGAGNDEFVYRRVGDMSRSYRARGRSSGAKASSLITVS